MLADLDIPLGVPIPGVRRTCRLIELFRARASEFFDLELEGCDGTSQLRLRTDVASCSAALAE